MIGEQQLVELRRHLHQNPETAFQEKGTQKKVIEVLEGFNPVKIWKVAGTGILVQCTGDIGAAGHLYRTDFDALPIQEDNPDLSYQSVNKGVAHLCGHDGHTAIAVGLCSSVISNGINEPIYVLFQPAEETGMGMLEVLKDETFNSIEFKSATAIHNLPSFELGTILTNHNTFSAAVSTLVFRFKGLCSHAAEPWNGKNPNAAISKLSSWLDDNNVFPKPNDFAFGTVVCVRVGDTAYGTNPGNGEIHITIRAANNQLFESFKNALKQKAEELAREEDLDITCEELEIFPATGAHEVLLTQLESQAQHIDLKMSRLPGPNTWGEDFGYLSPLFPTLMFGVGSGKNQKPLHNPGYNFPDEIIYPTIKLLTNYFKELHV
ncbi:amidohydrolase [Luteibaculum oceani]|uniref:Amidohydrolase n=1 Tax=Luteibaculum oceani TaxID=1294296 RepID=A0A5C6UU33_9FLAO|nr:amidohydrolase [Luteibaculum oceani]TXC76110.1 amidohydrolase [Luteibaculum oceani]